MYILWNQLYRQVTVDYFSDDHFLDNVTIDDLVIVLWTFPARGAAVVVDGEEELPRCPERNEDL
jgi:hypothetical protein